MKTWKRIMTALSVLLVICAPMRAQTTDTAGPITINGNVPTDTAIDERIESILDQIDGLGGIFVTVKSGVVILRGRVYDPALAAEAEAIAARVEGVVAVSNRIVEVTSVAQRIVPAWERLRARLVQAINYMPLFGVALLVFAGVAGLGAWLGTRGWLWKRVVPNAFIQHLVGQIVRLVFLGAGIVVALDFVGATALLGTFVGAAGIVGLAVGFAVRDTVENYIASILLSVRQPFHPNDWVCIDNIQGTVVMLTARATVLLDADGNHIRVPNATVFKAVITNYTRNPERRFSFTLGIDRHANLREAMEVGKRTIRDVPFTLADPPPDAWIEGFADSTVRIAFAGWVNQSATSYVQAKSEAIRLTKLALERNGFTLPEPAYRVLVEGDGKTALPQTRKTVAPLSSAAAKPETDAVGDTSPDHVAERKVAEERAKADRPDLLSPAAKQEMGS